MKCPQCQNEIPETNEAVQLCPFCGSSVNPFYAVQPAPALVRPEYPMKWYKFLIYFSLFASAVLNGLSAIGQLFGSTLPDIEAVYQQYPAMKFVDIVYGVLLVALTVMAIYTRQQLAHYKKNAPMCLYIMYGAAIAMSLIYIVATAFAMPNSETTVSLVVNNLPSLIASAVVLVLNIVYFQKRKELFVC